jgi:hypothetical protein
MRKLAKCDDCSMRPVLIVSLISLATAAGLSSKDKPAKVTFQQMAVGMRDAFSCGVVVEQHLHGTLKGKDIAYGQLRKDNHCDYVESVLNTLPSEP